MTPSMTKTDIKKAIALLAAHLRQGCCQEPVRKAIEQLAAELAQKQKKSQ